MPRDPQLLKGVLPMLVLALLTQQESYGYELVSRLQDAGLTDLSTGTVYPVLNRLEREGLVAARLVPSSTGPARKYYLPTPHGSVELSATRQAWSNLTDTVRGVLEHTPGATATCSSTSKDTP